MRHKVGIRRCFLTIYNAIKVYFSTIIESFLPTCYKLTVYITFTFHWNFLECIHYSRNWLFFVFLTYKFSITILLGMPLKNKIQLNEKIQWFANDKIISSWKRMEAIWIKIKLMELIVHERRLISKLSKISTEKYHVFTK